MTTEEFQKIREQYLDIVIGKPISITWPDHLIIDIVLKNGIAEVKGENKTDPTVYYKNLDTWLNDNGE